MAREVTGEFPDDVIAAAIAAAGEAPDEFLRAWAADHQEARRGERATQGVSVSPSDLSACQRWVWYRETPPEGYLPVEVPFSASALGILTHEGFTRIRAKRYPWRRFASRVLIPVVDRWGEYDEYDPVIGRVVDYKSASHFKWAKVATTPPDGEWDQVHLYAAALVDAGELVVDVELLYVNRDTGKIESFVKVYDPDRAARATLKLVAMLDALQAGRELPRERAGDRLLGPTRNTLCRDYCPAVVHCWGLDEAPDGRTPESRVLVHDDADIAAVAGKYDQARTVEATAKADREWLGDLIRGVDDGAYGDWVVKTTGGKPTAEKPDPVARVAQLEREMRLAREKGRAPDDPAALRYPVTRGVSPRQLRVTPKRNGQRTAAPGNSLITE